MALLIAICGFVGGWFLVAGPVWQAAIELQEEEIDQEAIEAARTSSKVVQSISPWWWLLPPVAYVLQSRRARANRRSFRNALAPEHLRQTVSFLNKANGWLVVAFGAFLIAVKETWDLVEQLAWPTWIFWVLVVVLPIVAVGNAVIRQLVSRRVLGGDANG